MEKYGIIFLGIVIIATALYFLIRLILKLIDYKPSIYPEEILQLIERETDFKVSRIPKGVGKTRNLKFSNDSLCISYGETLGPGLRVETLKIYDADFNRRAVMTFLDGKLATFGALQNPDALSKYREDAEFILKKIRLDSSSITSN